jgi:hypothetical protein
MGFPQTIFPSPLSTHRERLATKRQETGMVETSAAVSPALWSGFLPRRHREMTGAREGVSTPTGIPFMLTGRRAS